MMASRLPGPWNQAAAWTGAELASQADECMNLQPANVPIGTRGDNLLGELESDILREPVRLPQLIEGVLEEEEGSGDVGGIPARHQPHPHLHSPPAPRLRPPRRRPAQHHQRRRRRRHLHQAPK